MLVTNAVAAAVVITVAAAPAAADDDDDDAAGTKADDVVALIIDDRVQEVGRLMMLNREAELEDDVAGLTTPDNNPALDDAAVEYAGDMRAALVLLNVDSSKLTLLPPPPPAVGVLIENPPTAVVEDREVNELNMTPTDSFAYSRCKLSCCCCSLLLLLLVSAPAAPSTFFQYTTSLSPSDVLVVVESDVDETVKADTPSNRIFKSCCLFG